MMNLMDLDPNDLDYRDYVRLLWASVTFQYRCWANCLFGCDSLAYLDPGSSVVFPVRVFH